MTMRKLIYFAIRGRAEPIRFLLEDVGLEYEDFMFQGVWAEYKTKTPFGALPLYEEDGETIAHSQAIIRHLARRHGVYGSNERAHLLADIAEEAVVEAEDALWKPFWSEKRDAAMAEFATGPLKQTLSNLDAQLTRAGGPYWAGEELTFADYLVFRYLDEVDAFYSETLMGFGQLVAFYRRMAARPRLAAYVSSGRRSPALGIGLNGPIFDPRLSPSQ